MEEKLGNCIFCGKDVLKNSVEHIVPESLGNKNYILPKGAICGVCNNNFSKFEEKALTKSMLGFERARMGIPTKKGNAAVAKSGTLSWAGNKDFKKNIITISGITEDMIESVNEEDGSFKVQIKDFDKSDMSTSRLLLKMGYEALFTSHRKIFNKYDFKELTEHLTNINNKDWPFLTTASLELSTFSSIPRFNIKYELGKIRCRLLISEMDSKTLIFKFQYSVLSYMINLLNRSIEWTKGYTDQDELNHLYPEYLRQKKDKEAIETEAVSPSKRPRINHATQSMSKDEES